MTPQGRLFKLLLVASKESLFLGHPTKPSLWCFSPAHLYILLNCVALLYPDFCMCACAKVNACSIQEATWARKSCWIYDMHSETERGRIRRERERAAAREKKKLCHPLLPSYDAEQRKKREGWSFELHKLVSCKARGKKGVSSDMKLIKRESHHLGSKETLTDIIHETELL